MSSFMDAVFILPLPSPGTDVLRALNAYLAGRGATVGPGTLVVFNDWGDEEKEPLEASSLEEASASVVAWPGLGGISYSLPDGRISMFLLGRDAHAVDCVTLSASDRVYSSRSEAQNVFDKMIHELHDCLGARRTFAGYELLSPGSWVHEEVERVRRGTFDGQHPLDLRR